MKTKRISPVLLVLVTMAVALLPRAARAQAAVDGKFTLPTEVHWGTAVLPAGVYRFSVDAFEPSTVLRIYDESNPAVSYFVMTQGWDQAASVSGESRLILGNKDGETYVKELRLGSQGMSLYYGPPKLTKEMLARRSPPARMPAAIPPGK
jgi:hypothetical protein